MTWKRPLPSALTVYKSRWLSSWLRPEDDLLARPVTRSGRSSRRSSDPRTGRRRGPRSGSCRRPVPSKWTTQTELWKSCALGTWAGEGDLVALRRPASLAEVEVHPIRRDPLQAAAVQLDGVDLVGGVVRARDHEPFAVRRVVARGQSSPVGSEVTRCRSPPSDRAQRVRRRSGPDRFPLGPRKRGGRRPVTTPCRRAPGRDSGRTAGRNRRSCRRQR